VAARRALALTTAWRRSHATTMEQEPRRGAPRCLGGASGRRLELLGETVPTPELELAAADGVATYGSKIDPMCSAAFLSSLEMASV